MAKSKYFSHVEPKFVLIEGWARDGLTDEQIAEKLGIHISTLYDYKNKHDEFSEVLKKGKEVIDYEVEKALLDKALSGDTTAQIFWLKNRKPKQWRDKQVIESNSTIEIKNPLEGLTTDDLKKLIKKE